MWKSSGHFINNDIPIWRIRIWPWPWICSINSRFLSNKVRPSTSNSTHLSTITSWCCGSRLLIGTLALLFRRWWLSWSSMRDVIFRTITLQNGIQSFLCNETLRQTSYNINDTETKCRLIHLSWSSRLSIELCLLHVVQLTNKYFKRQYSFSQCHTLQLVKATSFTQV